MIIIYLLPILFYMSIFVSVALQRLLFDRVLDEFTTPPGKIQTRQIRDNKRRHRKDKDAMGIGPHRHETMQTEMRLEQQENLKNKILSEYKENSDVIPGSNEQKSPADSYHFWDKYPNRLGHKFDFQKEKRGEQGNMRDLGKLYNYLLDDSIGMGKPQEFIDEMWNDYNRDKPVNDVLKDIQKSKKENMDKINKLLARKSFLQDIGSDYDIPDYFKNLGKPRLLHDQTNGAKIPQELHGYMDLTESENVESTESNKEDSTIELETGYRREMHYKDNKGEHEKHNQLKEEITTARKKVTHETVETYPSFNFEPKYFTLPSRSPSKSSTTTSTSTKLLRKPENVHPTIAQYYAPPNMYPILLISETTKSNKRIITKLRDNSIVESNSVDLHKELIDDTETGIWNTKLAIRIKPFHPVPTIDSEHDTLSPSTDITVKTETELLSAKNDELEPTIVQYYQHQNFSPKIFQTKTKPALRSPTPKLYNNIHLGIFKSPTEAHTTHKTAGLSYKSLNLANEYNDLVQGPVHKGVFKADTERTTAHFKIRPIHLGIFTTTTETSTAHSNIAYPTVPYPINLGVFTVKTEGSTPNSSIMPIHLGVFRANTEETTSHSRHEAKHFGVFTEAEFKADTEGITTHSNIDAKHLGIFRDDTERITTQSSIEPIHLGIFKEHAKVTPGSNTVDDASIHLGLFKTHIERNDTCDDMTCPVSSAAALLTTTTTTETTIPTTTGPVTETTTIIPAFDTTILPTLFSETEPMQNFIFKSKHNFTAELKSRLAAADFVPKPRESQLGKNVNLNLLRFLHLMQIAFLSIGCIIYILNITKR